MPRFALPASVFAAATALSCSLAAPSFAQIGAPDVYAITGARIVPVSGPIIENGTLVLRDGLIAAVGANVSAPPDAKVIDGKGLTVYPALVNGYGKAGMPAAGEYPAARGDAHALSIIKAEYAAPSLLKPDATGFSNLRKAGFGVTLAAPQVGALSGTSAVISLSENGSDPASLVVRAPVAMHLNPAVGDSTGKYPESLMGGFAAVRQAMYDAQDAAARLDAYEKDPRGRPRPAVTRALTALRPVVEKRMPLVVHAESAQSIRRALKLAREFGLRPVIEGGSEAHALAAELKAAGASVLLSAALPEPPRVVAGEEDPSTLQGLRLRALAPTTAAALARAGVPFAITADGVTKPEDFTKNVRRMVVAGLPPAAAVEAVTVAPARLLGVERQLGTLEPGKIANILVVSGDLFGGDKPAQVKHLFVDGKKQDVEEARPSAPSGGPRTAAAGAPSAASPTPAFTREQAIAALPQGVTPEAAVQFLRQNPNGAKSFLPEGVSVEQAIAALEGTAPEAPAKSDDKKEPEKVAAPPKVGEGAVPPLPPAAPAAFVLRGADAVWTVGPRGVLKNADVYVKDGKVVSVGQGLKVPAGTAEIDARGKHVTPGMIDCHSHTAIDGGVNEGTNIVTAEVRVADVIDAEDVNIYRQLAGGTTAANLLHGSANAIGGQNAVVKWRWGKTADELLVAGAPAGIKFALGENPKQSNWSTPGQPARYPGTRMGVERVIRETFQAARDYKAQWALHRAGKLPVPPRRDLQLDTIVEILDGKRLVHCHSYRQDEILMMTRLAEEFGFKMGTFQHVLEGYKVADELARHGAGASTFSDWWAFKMEAWDAIPYNGALMTDRGVLVSFNSDSSELARRLNLEAAKAVHWGGLKPEEAIKLVTINPAKQLGIDRMTGSLEPGKDADLVVWSGDPLSTMTVAEKTFVDGGLYFDRAADLAARAALDDEKKRLAAAERPNAARPRTADSAIASRGEAATRSAGSELPQSNRPAPPAPAAQAKEPITGEITAIVGGTVHPVSGPDIPNGTVLVQGGRITAVGAAGSVAVPDGARKIDAAGLHVYPGLIDADTQLGLAEIGSIKATNDSREISQFSPELRAAIAINPDSEHLPVARANGILSAVTAPSGGTVSGMGALLTLDGWTWEDLALNPALGLYINFPATGGRRFRETAHRCEETAGDPHGDEFDDPDFRSGAFVPAGSRDTEAIRYGLLPNTAQGPAVPAGDAPERRDPDAALKPLNEFLDQARRYGTAKAAEGKNGAATLRNHDPGMEAMLPVLAGKVPVFIRADREKDIRAAVKWARENGLRMVLVGGREADKAADLLARENVPVIIGRVLGLPSRFDAPYDEAYTFPARLHKAGVRFCFSTGSSADVRQLPYNAAMAASFGLPADEALKAVTLYPAQILGAGDRMGSIEVGKSADLILTTGSPLEVTSEVKAALSAGRPVDLSNKHLRLYEKYKARPKK